MKNWKRRAAAVAMCLAMIGSELPVMADELPGETAAISVDPAETTGEEAISVDPGEEISAGEAVEMPAETETAAETAAPEGLENSGTVDEAAEEVTEAALMQEEADLAEPELSNEEPVDEEPGRQPEPFEPDPVSGLPILNIHLSGVNLETVINGSKEEKYEGCIIDLYEDGNVTTFTNVRVKGRGNVTWRYPKKPFQIKLDKKTNLFGQGKAKKWVLLADYSDVSALRNYAAFKLANACGLPNALPEGQHVNVYFDNEYQGLYYLTHKVEVGSNVVPLSNPQGVIVEVDTMHNPSDLSVVSEKGLRIMIGEAVEDDDEAMRADSLRCFAEKYNELERAVEEKDWQKIVSLCDVESFVKYFLIQEISGNPDAFAASYFMYMDGPEDVIHAGPVWDFDSAFKNHYVYGDTDNPNRTWAFVDARATGNPERGAGSTLFAGLMSVEPFYSAVVDEYWETFRPAIEMLTSDIVEESSRLFEALKKNNDKWKSGADGTKEAAQISAWLSERMTYLDFLYGSRIEEEGVYMVTGGSFHCPLNYKKQSDGFYTLTGSEGLCLDVAKASPLVDAKVQFHKSNGTDAQRWFFTPDGHIVSKATGLCLKADGSDLSLGSWGGKGQVFALQGIDTLLPEIEADTYYRLNLQKKDSYGLSVKSGSLYKKGNVVLRFGNTLEKMWLLEGQSDGSYVMRNARSRLVLEVAGGSLSKKANVRQNALSGDASQKWYLYKKPDGCFEVVNKKSLLTLDAAGGIAENDTNIQQYKLNMTKAQGWKLKKAGYDCQISGDVFIKSAMGESARAIEVAGASKQKKANIDIRSLTSSKSAVWKFERKSSGIYTIRNVNSGLVLDVQGGKTAKGTNVQQYTGNSTVAQRWVVIGNSDGTVTIFGQGSGKVLDAAGAKDKNGTNIQIYKANSTAAQKWKIESVAG